MRTSDIPGVAALLPDTPDRCCCFCLDPIPNYDAARRPPIMCRERECRRSYERLYAEQRRKVKPQQYTPEQRHAWYVGRRDRYWAAGLTHHGKPRKNEDDVRAGRPRDQH